LIVINHTFEAKGAGEILKDPISSFLEVEEFDAIGKNKQEKENPA